MCAPAGSCWCRSREPRGSETLPHPLRCAVEVGGPAVLGHSRQKRVCRGGGWGMATRRGGGSQGTQLVVGSWHVEATPISKQRPKL